MPITNKTCLCGCGRTFIGTSRRKWATPYCKTKNARKVKLEKAQEEIDLLKIKVDFESECG